MEKNINQLKMGRVIKLETEPRYRGYVLTIPRDIAPKKCDHCHMKLELPFFYCKYFDVGICKRCQKMPEDNICGYRSKDDHTHYNVVEVKRT